VILLITIAGCAPPDTVATFEASGAQRYQSCIDQLFPFAATFAATRQRIDSTGYFWMASTQPTYDTDLVYLEVYDRQAARNSGNSPVQFVYRPETTGQPMRIEIHPEGTCPDANISLVAEGTVRFDTFSDDNGDTVTGQLLSGAIIDARTGETVADTFTGEWDFNVTSGYPAQFYPSYDSDEYNRNP
jgi:hypothetical protein